MNKKIITIISVALAVVCLTGFVGFNIYNNKKVEAQAQEQAQEQEMADKTAVNAKDDNGNYADPTATTTQLGDTGMTVAENAELQDFFDGCLRTMFNVKDTSNISATTEYLKENVNPDVIDWLNTNFYSKYKTISLTNYSIKLIRKDTITYKNEQFPGYEITYTNNFKEDGKDDNLVDNIKSENEEATAYIIKKNNKLFFAKPAE